MCNKIYKKTKNLLIITKKINYRIKTKKINPKILLIKL